MEQFLAVVFFALVLFNIVCGFIGVTGFINGADSAVLPGCLILCAGIAGWLLIYLGIPGVILGFVIECIFPIWWIISNEKDKADRNRPTDPWDDD